MEAGKWDGGSQIQTNLKIAGTHHFVFFTLSSYQGASLQDSPVHRGFL